MFLILGIVFALISVFTGYILHHGPMHIFIEAWTEYIVILGSAFGVFLGANGMPVLKQTIAGVLGLLKPSPFTKQAFTDLLAMMFAMFYSARKDGLLAMEAHIEKPHESAILSKYHGFLHHHHAVDFFCDNMKVLMNGGVAPIDLDTMMEQDIDATSKEAHVVPEAVQGTADALPALGIVACVLGVVITMGKIGGDPKDIGHAVAVALIGTFLGVAVAYLVVAPTARALGLAHAPEEVYLQCMRGALLSFARGESPITCVEFARRNIPPSLRPSFADMEKACKEATGKA